MATGEVASHDWASRACQCVGCHGARQARKKLKPRPGKHWWQTPGIGAGRRYMGEQPWEG